MQKRKFNRQAAAALINIAIHAARVSFEDLPRLGIHPRNGGIGGDAQAQSTILAIHIECDLAENFGELAAGRAAQ